jgi:hypothetical protein
MKAKAGTSAVKASIGEADNERETIRRRNENEEVWRLMKTDGIGIGNGIEK